MYFYNEDTTEKVAWRSSDIVYCSNIWKILDNCRHDSTRTVGWVGETARYHKTRSLRYSWMYNSGHVEVKDLLIVFLCVLKCGAECSLKNLPVSPVSDPSLCSVPHQSPRPSVFFISCQFYLTSYCVHLGSKRTLLCWLLFIQYTYQNHVLLFNAICCRGWSPSKAISVLSLSRYCVSWHVYWSCCIVCHHSDPQRQRNTCR